MPKSHADSFQPSRPLLLLALLLSIPAFYMVLDNVGPYRDIGRWLYVVVALFIGVDWWKQHRQSPTHFRPGRTSRFVRGHTQGYG